MPPLDAAQSDGWVTVPPAASGAPSSENDGWVTVPPVAQHWAAPAGGEFGDLNAQASAPPTPQGQVGADVNAVGQGLVSGTGAAIAGAGRIAQAGTGPSAARVLAALDLVDEGKNRDAYQKLSDSERQQVGAYRGSRPEDKQAQRDALQQTISDYDKPNALTQAGMAVEGAAPTLFPVDPANEGIQTGVGRMIGGAGPALAAGAIGGPPGVLASLAVIGSQAYDGAYQDAVSKGVTHEAADDAAGKSALAQAVTMVAPVGRLLQRVPMPLREGLTATLVNLGQHGVEFGTANALGTFVNNYVAQTYDPDRSLTQGTGQAGLEGVIAGLVIRGAATGAGAARAQPGPGPRATGAPAVGVSDVMKAPDIDGAIAAAGEAASAPSTGASDTLAQTIMNPPGSRPAANQATTPNATQPTGTDWGQLFGSGPMGNANGSYTPTLTMSSGQKVQARFDVAEARDLIPASGDLQPRDRAGRLASDAQITQMAANLDPELLHASPGPDQGAPTVNANGVILAGNGRTQAIRQAYAMGNADPYRAMVERYGFDTTGMSEPVLIRRIDQQMTPEQDRQIAVESNIPSGQRLSATEQAAIDARGMSSDLLGKYNPLLTGGPTAAGNRDFVRSWIGTLPEGERNSVQGADGSISSDGVRRLQGAMLARAYGDQGTLARSLESTDDNTRTLTGALTDAAPAWAQLQAEIASGRVPQTMDVAPQLTRAIDLVGQAREKGQSVRDVLSQSDAFNPIDPVTEAFVKAFYNPALTRAASRPLVAEVLRRYATEASKTSSDAGLFGDSQPAVTPADILATVVSSARSEPPALAAPMPESVGAAASAQNSSAAELAQDPREFLAVRNQGEIERLGAPPPQNDRTVYIPGVKSSLAEVTGNPVAAMDQAYNRQQPEAMTQHIERENKTADAIADYYADTAGSAPELLRMDRARGELAARNIQTVFGDPHATRTPADPTPTIKLINGIMSDPRQAERSTVMKIFAGPNGLLAKFTNADGNMKTDPYALYGIGEHINDLLAGIGSAETSSAASVLKRELTQVKQSLYDDIEGASPGFAQYRQDFERDSGAIDAMKLLQDARLPLLTGTSQHITPSKWFNFMRNVVAGRTDPFDPAYSLSEDQMDRLWNITDQLKRSTFIDAGKPRGSWTSMMQEWGGRFARLAAHGIAAHSMPIVGNMGVEMGVGALRKRSVTREMERVLNPDLGQQSGP
jgi:hypothetical protein